MCFAAGHGCGLCLPVPGAAASGIVGHGSPGGPGRLRGANRSGRLSEVCDGPGELLLLPACCVDRVLCGRRGGILIAGLRPGEAGLSGPQGAGWSRGRLAIALAVACLPPDDRVEPGLGDPAATGDTSGRGGALAISVAPPRLPDRDNAGPGYQ